MFSSLYFSENFTIISIKKLISLKCVSPSKDHILIVKHPYEKLKSFYRDKFIKFPSDICDYPDTGWQHWHDANPTNDYMDVRIYLENECNLDLIATKDDYIGGIAY